MIADEAIERAIESLYDTGDDDCEVWVEDLGPEYIHRFVARANGTESANYETRREALMDLLRLAIRWRVWNTQSAWYIARAELHAAIDLLCDLAREDGGTEAVSQ